MRIGVILCPRLARPDASLIGSGRTLTGSALSDQVSCPSLFIADLGVEQPTLGVDDETDYDNYVFDPRDCDGLDDAM